MKTGLVLLLIMITFSISADNWIYEMELIEIPTGNANEEIYIYDVPDYLKDVPDEGPTKFQTDELGNIYILNEKKIKKFDSDGNFMCSTQAEDLIIVSFIIHQDQLWTTCGDNQNKVYLRRFDAFCQLVDTHQIENQESSLAINQNREVGLNLGNNNFLEFEINDKEFVTTNGIYLTNAILDFNAREGRQKVLIPEENIEVDLNEIWSNDIGHSLIGFDETGNLYFNIYSKILHDSRLGITSEAGEIIETNIIFPHYTKFGLDFGKGISNIIAMDGKVYQMIPMKDKIEIRKWKRVK
jgi:hypothetical protein